MNIQVRIIIMSGTTQILTEMNYENVRDFTSSSDGYYFFRDKDGKEHYYPINHTIVHQL